MTIYIVNILYKDHLIYLVDAGDVTANVCGANPRKFLILTVLKSTKQTQKKYIKRRFVLLLLEGCMELG